MYDPYSLFGAWGIQLDCIVIENVSRSDEPKRLLIETALSETHKFKAGY